MEKNVGIGWSTKVIQKPYQRKFEWIIFGGASIIETCLQMMIDLWEMRNEEVQGKEEKQSSKRGKPRKQSVCKPYTTFKR